LVIASRNGLNSAWLSAALLASAALLSWLALTALDGELARAAPKTIRYRILHTAARITYGGRRRQVRVPHTWPWAQDPATAWSRVQALPQCPDSRPARPTQRHRRKTQRGPWSPRPPGPAAGPSGMLRTRSGAVQPNQEAHSGTIDTAATHPQPG